MRKETRLCDVFIAEDGKEFPTEYKCALYEANRLLKSVSFQFNLRIYNDLGDLIPAVVTEPDLKTRLDNLIRLYTSDSEKGTNQ
jgi:hypothetical protein